MSGAESARSVAPTPRAFRFSILTLMSLVLAASLAVALFMELQRLAEEIGSNAEDGPSLVTIAMVLTSIAVGAWRHSSVALTALQFATACSLVLLVITMALAGWIRPAIYWFQGVFALTIVLPLLLLRMADAAPARHRLLEPTAEVLMSSGVTLVLVLIGVLLQVLLFEVVPSIF